MTSESKFSTFLSMDLGFIMIESWKIWLKRPKKKLRNRAFSSGMVLPKQNRTKS
jgi:hypothetical protein